ncbi:hypothetical protein FA15DRAFT_690761 [Coprinopsis marcescibilis]|uniref:Metaxin glutathione S-transferase domain-containing protein n=1 Tax=Coprinopsis marcescibilis TaxID=230819 RepID=A0A5C3LBT3_COPMA|nr:hypothetical protein FA15DRAFT_690761 [Coprinopsis marcescibilis]
MLTAPKPIAAFFSLFPLKSHPPIDAPGAKPESSPTRPTLWISPPPASSSLSASTSPVTPTSDTSFSSLLSADVECLKWQAYIALRGLTSVKVRWDIRAEGALDARLPNLHLLKPDGDKLNADLNPAPAASDKDKNPTENAINSKLYLYNAHIIPSWVDLTLGVDSASDTLEGYVDVAARDESRAWVSLLEGIVHAALILHTQKQPSVLSNIFNFSATTTAALAGGNPSSVPTPGQPHPLQTIMSPPPAPLTGYTSIFPAFGTRVNPAAVLSQYRDAIASLAERLGTDKWFLGSSEPTPLDALAFAYLHCILGSTNDTLRVEVTKRVNLVAWEWRVRDSVRTAFIR